MEKYEDLEFEWQLQCDMIGLRYKRPYYWKGRMHYRPYRNHFDTAPGTKDWSVLEKLAEEGFAASRPGLHGKQRTFYLTRAGLDRLGERLKITITEMR